MQSSVEKNRLALSRSTDAGKKSRLGQFLTPERIATFMAGLFPAGEGSCRLLDAGAGIGSLSAAFLERWRSGDFRFTDLEVDAYEVDPSLIEILFQTLNAYAAEGKVTSRVRAVDYIHAAVDSLSQTLFSNPPVSYTHAILNPPYKKIGSNSAYRLALRRVGIEAVNLYNAFVALALAQLTSGGHMVAIIPRSFCNGPYYRPFREYVLKHAAIQHIHLFGSRNTAFKDDAVLQENVILHLQRGVTQGPVTVSISTDDTFSDLYHHRHPFDRIVFPDDIERFIHIPLSPEYGILERMDGVCFTLEDLGLSVSTGPVVDFRLKEHLRSMPAEGTVPLLYPGHIIGGKVHWPLEGMKKANAIACNQQTRKWLYPVGDYCVVRRFSAKEEKRRVVAGVVEADAFEQVAHLGFENHLNVFHTERRGLTKPMAYGLMLYLNTTAFDEAFRRFNGHTQVNATDLRLMNYPSREVLIRLGEWAMTRSTLTQAAMDDRFDEEMA